MRAGIGVGRWNVRCSWQEVMLATAIVVAGIGAGMLPAIASAEVCPNASSRSGPSASLPDCRFYEMVSPVENDDGNVYVPDTGTKGDAIPTPLPFRASADGNTVAYVGDASSEGNGSTGAGEGNNYLATRNPGGGWAAHDIQADGLGHVYYQAFSSDLAVGILDSTEVLPEAGAPEESAGYDLLYSRTSKDGAYHPLFTSKPPDRLPTTGTALGEFGSADPGEGQVHPVLYAGANSGSDTVPAFRHILFEANDALTTNAVDGGDEANNLYDSIDGQLSLVNVLPSGASEPNKNATFGAPRAQAGHYVETPDFSHVISADGSRIFWSSLNSAGGLENLYVREDGTETVQIAEGGRFWTANSEGTKAFFTKGDLYEWYDVDGEPTTTDLTPGIEVRGVLGASENGAYVYYVDANNNLDLWHEGVTTFIAAVSPNDDNFSIIGEEEGETVGDWQPGLGQRTAEVTPDGHNLVFMSSQSLTGYTNEGLQEVYVYDTDTDHLSCVSCDPSGAPPVIAGEPKDDAAFLPLSYSIVRSMNTYQPRWISEDGSRVFFDSVEPLVSQDVNGLQDVYEWERDGAGSCQDSEGCVYLLSGATSTDISAFVDASSNGDDAFFVTRAQLVPQDGNENDDLYDAHVGGVQPLSTPVCSGTGCQGVPSAPPLFATPPSATFDGVGNLEAPAPTSAVKPKTKPLTRSQKLAKALKVCMTRPKKKRAACNAQAKKSYRAKPKTKKPAQGRK